MAETAPTQEAPKQDLPKRTCEKCRNQYTLEHFNHGVEGQECVCRRCLAVMGYRL
jgi:hypothetical protein